MHKYVMNTLDERRFLKRVLLECADSVVKSVVKEEGVDLLFGSKWHSSGSYFTLFPVGGSVSDEFLSRFYVKVWNELAKVRVNGYHLSMSWYERTSGEYRIGISR